MQVTIRLVTHGAEVEAEAVAEAEVGVEDLVEGVVEHG